MARLLSTLTPYQCYYRPGSVAKWFGSGPSAIPTTDPGTSPREQYRRRATAQGTIAGAERRCPVPWHESRAPGKEHGIVGPDNQRGRASARGRQRRAGGNGTKASSARGRQRHAGASARGRQRHAGNSRDVPHGARVPSVRSCESPPASSKCKRPAGASG